MAVAPFSILALPFALMLSSILTAPLSGPPLPLDPALAKIAPEKCLWYASAAGLADPDPSSTNQSEQLFAEPEIRFFSAELEKQFLRILRRSADHSSEGRVLAAELPKLVKALLRRPLAAFVEDFRINDDGFEMQAGFVLNAGELRAEIEQAIANLVDLSLTGGIPIGAIEQDGATWHIMRLSMQTPEVRWGWQGDYLILAVGDGTAEKIIDRLENGSTPDWLEALRNESAIPRESSLVRFDLALLLERLRPTLESEGVWPIVEKLGLASLQTFHRCSGFDEVGCASVAKLITDGQRRGLLSLVPDKQLSGNDLKMIPHNAMIAAAIRCDAADTWENILRLGEEFDPRAVEEIRRNLDAAEDHLGVNLEDDLIGSLDDIWTAYMPDGDLMSAWVGSAFAVKVKDAPRLRTAIKTLVNDVRAKMPQGNRGPQIRESEFEGQTIYTVTFVGAPIPFSPAWCVTDDWLFLGLTPQTVRGLMTRGRENSLADVSEVREVFGHDLAPTAIAYLDTPKLVRSAYPLLQMGAQMLSAQLQREGIDIDTTILPSADAIVKHLRPSMSIMADSQHGPAFYSRHSLPSGGGVLTLAPLALGGTLPARASAQRATNLNNMKQIALAFHNYESTYGKLPNNIYDDEGKALLSWRVRLLPFLEQQALYTRFHLDEPWDSEHNKPLSQLVLQVFRSPDSPANGKTRYLALVNEGTLFPGNEEVRFRDVTDGLSNTIMFVEAKSDAAVSWSQPTDLAFDPDRPFVGVENSKGQFAAAFSDGSCHTLSLGISEDSMRALATRAGGETLAADALHQ